MYVDARALQGPSELSADLCIIGAGVAGITLSSELAKSGLRIVILESGNETFEARTQALYKGRTSGPFFPEDDDFLESYRLRFLGGTSNHWSGQCYPLLKPDFEVRPWIPDSGWPITFDGLWPYYERAAVYHRLYPDHTSPPTSCAVMNAMAEGGSFTTQFFQATEPLRFKDLALPLARSSENVAFYVNANLTRITRDAGGRNVTEIVARTLTGAELKVRARCYVLATGCVENARILLLNDIGNDHGVVGRYFASHLYVTCGILCLGQWMPASLLGVYYPDKKRKTVYFGKLSTTVELQRRHELRGFAAQLVPLEPDDAATWRLPAPVAAHLRADPAARAYWISVGAEQSPYRESRVVLTAETDELEQRRVYLDWRAMDEDIRSIKTSVKLLAQYVGSRDIGRVYDFWSERSRPGHMMGATRMHDDPQKGVVDRNCLLHGMENLFVMGSSVFTTGGTANPTFTLTALSIRLADHLGKMLGGAR